MTSAGAILISILTLNIWGLPGKLTVLKNDRIQGICKELKRAAADPEGWDAVMLQEVWLKEDRRTLSQCGYRQSVDLNAKMKLVDSGLMFLSKHRLKNARRLTYPRIPIAPGVAEEGEALVRKSANSVEMVHPEAGPIVLANTHLVSYYAQGEKDKYQSTRRSQFRKFANWIKKLAQEKPVIVGGDWNFGSKNQALWSEKNHLFSDFVVSKESEKETTLSSENSFQEEDQDRVDHVFASSHFESIQGQLAMHEPIEAQGKLVNLSDHFGWSETFSLPRR